MEVTQVEVQYLDTEQAAQYTGYSIHTIRDAAARGRLACYRRTPRGHLRFRRAQLDAWMAEMERQVSPPRIRRAR